MISYHHTTIVRLRAPLISVEYGAQEYDWTNAVELPIDLCAVTPLPGSQYLIDRQAITTRWRLEAPPDADIVATDRIRHAAIDYAIEGSVEQWPSPTGRLAHVECLLRRVEG